MNTLEAFNQALFLTINATTSTPRWQIGVASCVADYVIYLVPLVLAALWLSGNRDSREAALRACCVTLLALGFNQIIGLAWMHPRPFMIGLGHTFVEHAPDSSFPSDHGTVFASVALTLLFARVRWAGLLTLVAGLAVAWSRVYIGVHFPFDMLGAALIACVAYVLVWPLWSLAGNAAADVTIVLYRKLLAWPIARGWMRT
ncbi:phosphatase PAP2 family protein [Paraburkholderia phymatum]|uniref:Phosphoesterase PA-phosphatase related n=1 Tax=Paraburkholderia phymatum (strain DSM 17167 / CIP 108236 / LMG 21445 / STM815) TaxID=391038 RepID=B2JUL1_PARP8|nr:phosphatase PAP2 family protein [Paraburkholderia phymatum]ACC76182.1 phosphoesterase PA-phosphatase related [Paraburkholderia phymatum STM815]